VSTLVALRALGLGDTLTAFPALRALAAAFPSHHRVLVMPAALGPLACCSGAVDEVVDSAPLAPLSAALHGADLAVNLHGKGPESTRLLLAARPARLLAFAHPEVPETAGGPLWRAGEHEVARWCRLLAEAGIPADPRALAVDPPPGPAPVPAGATVIHPGAGNPIRRWPPRRYAAVARAEAAAGRPVVVTGRAEEAGLAAAVARFAGLPPGAVLAGRTDALALARVVAAAGRVVSGDTGIAHLATALGTPSVVLFGPSSPAEWGPPERPWHRVVSVHPRPITAIGVGDVLAALDVLERGPVPSRRAG
jgi:ADP-heptose:LPS heptosyltransferase